MSSNVVSRLLAKNIDGLYEDLGRALTLSEYPRGAPVARPVAVERGRSVLADSIDQLKAKICVEWHYCNKRSDYGNFQSLTYAITPLVSSVVGVPASTALVVAVILVKIGLDDLCKCPNPQSNQKKSKERTKKPGVPSLSPTRSRWRESSRSLLSKD